jgi:hypothetical protein
MEKVEELKKSIEEFFDRVRAKAPIKLRDLCYLLPDTWDFTDVDFESLAIDDGDRIYWFHLDIDAELTDDEDPIIRRIEFRGAKLIEVIDKSETDVLGLYEEGNICSPYTEWGL